MFIGVYGTLRKGFGNHGLMQRCRGELVGTGITKEKMILLARGIPYLSRLKQEHHVVIEVYDVPDNLVYMLDGLEGHPDWYKREETDIIEVVSSTGEPLEDMSAWVYFMDNAVTDKNVAVVSTGDFANR